MMTKKESIIEYLEVVGNRSHDGKKLPFIALPTTSGTGSEATKISYASYISGLTLANASLGVVHGFASVIGGLFKIPHGVICGALLSEATRQNIEALISADPNSAALHKYAKAAGLLDPTHISGNPAKSSRYLVTLLTQWTELMNIPNLSAYGVTHNDIDLIVRATGQKNNPIQPAKKLSQILQARL